MAMFNNLITWSKKEFSHLPWRANRTLYRTLVSEIMLQQTTVSTVLGHFERFYEKYPDLLSLALATEEEITMSWKGLGYYRRARNLRNAAIYMEENCNGRIPENINELMGISGIGPYTANALLAIGLDQKALPIDANIERVLSRLYTITEKKGPPLQKKIKELFLNQKILTPIGKLSPRALVEALMDLGRTFCQAKRANCEQCPLKTNCLAFKTKNPLSYPIIADKDKKQGQHELHLLRIYFPTNGRILAYRKSSKEWLSGQLELPTFILKTDDSNLTQYNHWPLPEILGKKLIEFKSSITKYKIKNTIVQIDKNDHKDIKKHLLRCKFFKTDFQKNNFSTTTTKAFKKLELL